MEFLQELLLPGNTSLAATLVLLSFVIAVGIYLGKIRFWGVSLGVTFVLFVGTSAMKSSPKFSNSCANSV